MSQRDFWLTKMDPAFLLSTGFEALTYMYSIVQCIMCPERACERLFTDLTGYSTWKLEQNNAQIERKIRCRRSNRPRWGSLTQTQSLPTLNVKLET